MSDWAQVWTEQVIVRIIHSERVETGRIQTSVLISAQPVYCFTLFHWYCGYVQIHLVLIINANTVIITDESAAAAAIFNVLQIKHCVFCTLQVPPLAQTKWSISSRWECASHRQSPVDCYTWFSVICKRDNEAYSQLLHLSKMNT